MANPQKEHGFVPIANEIVEAFCRCNFAPYESRVLWAILRKTYGWKKKKDFISVSQMQELTGLDRRNVSRAKIRLLVRRVIVERNKEIGLNKNYDEWGVFRQTTPAIVYRDTRPRFFPPPGFDYKHSQDVHCEHCCSVFKFSQTHSHHIIPKSWGGNDSKENLCRICIQCHNLFHEKLKEFRCVSTDDINFCYRHFVSLLSSKQTQFLSSHETPQKTIKDNTKDSGGVIFNPCEKPVDNSKRFTPPSLSQVVQYCKERKNGVNCKRFIDFYQSKGWMVGKNKMKDWKAAVRGWESDNKPQKHLNQASAPTFEEVSPEDQQKVADMIHNTVQNMKF